MEGLSAGIGKGLNVGANMSGDGKTNPTTTFFAAYSQGVTSFTAPFYGYFTFVARGPGGQGAASSGAGGGAASRRTVLLAKGQVVPFVVGKTAHYNGQAGTATVVTFPDGRVMSAGVGGQGGLATGGVATGGDLNINGNAEVGGAGGTSPAIDNFPETMPNQNGVAEPGQGMSATGGPSAYTAGGPGILYVSGFRI